MFYRVSYNFEGMCDNPNSHQLLSVISAVHHQGVRQPFDDGTLRLSESLRGITASGVRDVDRRADLDVVAAARKGIFSNQIKGSR